MSVEHYKKIMIECLYRHGYDTWDGVKYGEDEFGEYFMYRYPGHDENRYYFDRNIITEDWKKFHDIRITRINSRGEEKFPWYASIIFYEGKYYITQEYPISVRSTFGPKAVPVLCIEGAGGRDDRGDKKDKNIKTMEGFKRAVKILNLRGLDG
jgi:hypothetical protein